MSIELSRDANALLEDIELELASIRAAMALRPLEPSQRLASPVKQAQAPVPAIGPFDLTRSGAESPREAVQGAVAVATSPDEPAKRPTLQQRLAAMSEEA